MRSLLVGALLVAFAILAASASSSETMHPSKVSIARYIELQKTLDRLRPNNKRDNDKYVDFAAFTAGRPTGKAPPSSEVTVHGDHVHLKGDGHCWTVEHEEWLRQRYPERGTREEFELLLRDIQRRPSKRAQVNPPVEIATIVHVIYDGESLGSGSNIGLSQIQSQFTALDKDYAGGTGFGANASITFRLVDVNRVDRNSKGWSAPPYTTDYINSVIKPATITNENNYLNLWVLALSDGLLGYAQFPTLSGLAGLDPYGGPSSTDGVVILNTAFGTSGTAASPYNGGRTATHEIGHFFGLRHIWGDDAPNCGNDYCDDTPQASEPNYGCPNPAPVTCSAGPNQITNYMDYTYDACMNRFTSCQVGRMYTVLENSPRRGGLIYFGNLTYDVSLQIVNPEDGNLCITSSSSSVTPSFSVTNEGSVTIYNASITLTIDSGSPSTNPVSLGTGLATGQTTTVTWPTAIDFSSLSQDSHSVTATLSNLNGNQADEDPYSNTDSVVFYLSKDRPDNYETDYEGTVFPPAGWTITAGGWTGIKDVVQAGSSTSLGNSAVSPLYYLERLGSQYPMIYSDGFTVGSDGSTVSFDLAYAPYTNGTHVVTGDALTIVVTAQCTSEQQVIYSKSGLDLQTTVVTGDSYIPSDGADWRTESAVISNSALFGQSVTVSFITTTGYGNNVWIDNVKFSTGQNGAASSLRSWLH